MNSVIIAVLTRVVAAFAIAMAGGAASALLARTHRQLCALISLGAGTLLGVTIFAIVPECAQTLSWWQFGVAALAGYLLFALITKYVFHVCPACAASHFDEATTHHFGEIALAMMIALGIHCTLDGLALAAGLEGPASPAAARAALQAAGAVPLMHAGGGWLDMSVTMAICVHKAPEGLALGSLLLGAGYRRSRMLWLVAAVESTTILGGVLGWFAFGSLSPVWVALALANAGGGFFFLAIQAVMGEIMKHERKIVVVNFLAGVAAIGALIIFFHLRE